jgi:nucleoid-associated protein YgaU
MPVFEALLPNTGYGQAMISLIAICARWHALAKLRMHTDDTLQMLEEATTELGSQFRSFVRDVCEHIATRELPAEAAEREEREKRQAEKKAAAVSEKATKKAVVAEKAAAKKAVAAEKAVAKKAEKAAAKKTENVARAGKTVPKKGVQQGTKAKGGKHSNVCFDHFQG